MIIIVANSPYHNFDNYIYNKEDKFIGIEDGALEIINRGFKLDLAIGDFDHTTNLELIKKEANLLISFPKDKDQIDLELALMYLKDQLIKDEIRIYNAVYGRIDHELITIKLLYKYDMLNLKLFSDHEIIYLIDKDTYLPDNKTFSLIPLNDVELSIDNAKYNLKRTIIKLNDNFTSSNQSLNNTLIKIYNGKIILIINNN